MRLQIMRLAYLVVWSIQKACQRTQPAWRNIGKHDIEEIVDIHKHEDVVVVVDDKDNDVNYCQARILQHYEIEMPPTQFM